MLDLNLIDVENNKNGNIAKPVIKVIGVGGGGCNAVRDMMKYNIGDVEFICANTDAQSMQDIKGATIVQLGYAVTKGLGAGIDPEIGKKAALEDKDRLREILKDTDLLFIATCLGGGTGSGSTPVIVEIAKELGILTVAVVTTPFTFEGSKRAAIAKESIRLLEDTVDTLIPIPNDKVRALLPENGKDVGLQACFSKINDILSSAVLSISDVIQRPGFINLDFADIRKIMQGKGLAIIGSGFASGKDRATEAITMALNNPLLDNMKLQGASGILVNIVANEKFGYLEIDEIAGVINGFASVSNDVDIKYGVALDPDLGEELKIMVIATGVSAKKDQTNEGLRLTKSNNAKPSMRTLDNAKDTKLNAKKTGTNDDKTYTDIPTWLRVQLN